MTIYIAFFPGVGKDKYLISKKYILINCAKLNVINYNDFKNK